MNSAARLLLLLTLLTRVFADAVQDQFQKALFEEEANQNLAGAINAYQEVIETAEAQRRYGATALFRLGECYRKLGRTNDAIAAYQRVINEHPGQTNVVTLSRQNLVVLGGTEGSMAKTQPQNAIPIQPSGIDMDLAEAARIEGILKAIADYKSKGQDWGLALATAFSSPELTQTSEAIRALTMKMQSSLSKAKPGQEQALTEMNTELATLRSHLADSLDRLMESKRLEVEMLRVGAQARQKALGLQSPAKAEPEDPETTEIQRLEKLEKESPDLLRAFDQSGNNALHMAAEKGQTRVVEHLLSRGLDINQQSQNNQDSILHRAVRAGRLTIVDLLLKRGADINARNRSSETAIYLAIALKYPSIIDRLLLAKPDLDFTVNGKGEGEQSPISLAVKQDDVALIKRLISSGAKISQPAGTAPLAYIAIVRGNVSALEVLLNVGADVHERYAGNRSPQTTLLHYAVMSDKLDKTLPLLLAKGADKEVKDSGEWCPLFLALNGTEIRGTMPREQRVALLLSAGANPNSTSGDYSPLISAISYAENSVRPLLEAKADPNFRPQRGTFPIISALDPKVSPETVRMLLEAGANPNVLGFPQASGVRLSAIETAISYRDRTKLELLLKHGADPNRRNAYGRTPLEYARAHENSPAFSPGNPPLARSAGVPRLPRQFQPDAPAQNQATIAELVETLRKAGARENLPDFDTIKVGRKSTATTALRIRRDVDGLNRITLLEAIAMAMRKIDTLDYMKDFRNLAANQTGRPMPPIYGRPDELAWPDWQKVTISRPAADGLSWVTIPVSPDVLFKTGACDDMPLLQWGDVVDIPEAIHDLSYEHSDPADPLLRAFTSCIYGGRITVMTPGSTNLLGKGYEPQNNSTIRPSSLTDWIVSTVLRSSSDVSRVTVRRAAFRNEPAWVRTFDLTFDSPEQIDLFLRDGDVVEVPDLTPETSGKSSAKVRVFGALHGTIPLPETQTARLSDVLAGLGRNDSADLKNVKLYRTDPQNGSVDTIEADVEKILRTKDRTGDVELRNGDRIEVPRK